MQDDRLQEEPSQLKRGNQPKPSPRNPGGLIVPTPTYASFLNRIESHFGTIDEFVCKNADYLDWDSFALAMAEHIRYRNTPEARNQRRLDAEKRRQRRASRQTPATLKLAA